MGSRRAAVAAILLISFIAAPLGSPATTSNPDPGPLRHVSQSGVDVYIPQRWEHRPVQTEAARRYGIQASTSLERGHRSAGLEAYWVDATASGIPSDYYTLAARGPVMDDLLVSRRCRPKQRNIVIGRGDSKPARGFVATVAGRCAGQTSTRWAAFVAAPAFGPVRSLGIPQSGLYYVRVAVREGPGADRRLKSLLGRVSFGGTTVDRFLAAAEPTRTA